MFDIFLVLLHVDEEDLKDLDKENKLLLPEIYLVSPENPLEGFQITHVLVD